jgi:hypothetical protein
MHWQIFCAKLLVTAPVALLTLAILSDMTQLKAMPIEQRILDTNAGEQ